MPVEGVWLLAALFPNIVARARAGPAAPPTRRCHLRAPNPVQYTSFPMAKPGRPVLFDTAKQNVFLRLIAAGIPTNRAARHVGVSPSTIREKARTSPVFQVGYEKAKSEALANLLDSVHTAGSRSWRAAAWLLERLRPEEFGRRQPLPPPPPPPAKQPRPTFMYHLKYLDDDIVNDFFDRLGLSPDAWETACQRIAQLEGYIADEKRRREEYLRWKEWHDSIPGNGRGQVIPFEDNVLQPSDENRAEPAHYPEPPGPAPPIIGAAQKTGSANNSLPVSDHENSQLPPTD
jgi:hypothetical protein